MSVQTTRLANGLTVATETMNHVESVSMGAWIRSGSRNEKVSEHGVAHMLEHMAFKGTNGRTAREIVEQVENVGGDVNAATSLETTSYYARMLKDDMALGVDILHDILTNSTIEESELKREKHVVLQEIGASKDTPEDMVFDHFQSAAFRNQALGRSIMGTPESVTSFQAGHLREYLDAHYHGPNMVLSCAGALEHDELLKLASDGFGEFSAEIPEEAESAKYIGGEYLEKRDLMEAQIAIGFEGRAYHARDFYTSQLLATIMGGGMSSRLFQEVREKRGLCYSVYAFHQGFSDTGAFGIHAATGEEDIEELIPVIVEELKHAAQSITLEETNRARAQIRAHLLMSTESPTASAAQNASQLLLYGRIISNAELMERLNAISPERIRNLAERLFFDTTPTIAAVGPIDGMPNQAQLTEMLNHG
ncbi:MAG: insulinase family protein [Hyphomicrobiales bacterium]|nr:insulinase family protein [Hyphomicrobiales bacterium]